MHSVLRLLMRDVQKPPRKLLILGDAVIHFSPAALQELANRVGFRLYQLPMSLTPHTLGEALGFSSVDTLDINGKASLNVDLQQSLPEPLVGKYDLVIDAGVLFWCFDPGVVLKNIFRLTATGGVIFHITALTGYFGRGYYNIHPRLLEDFYLMNQCVFIQSSFRTKPRPTFKRKAFRFLKKILRLVEPSDPGITYRDATESVYLGKANHNLIEFQESCSYCEADMIPNNVVFTFACRKAIEREPASPSQTC